MATKRKPGRPPKVVRIPDSFENVIKALVKPVKRRGVRSTSNQDAWVTKYITPNRRVYALLDDFQKRLVWFRYASGLAQMTLFSGRLKAVVV